MTLPGDGRYILNCYPYGTFSKDEMIGLARLSEENNLSIEQLAKLRIFYDIYILEIRDLVDEKKKMISKKVDDKYLDSSFKFFVTARAKSFLRTLNKISRKCGEDKVELASLFDGLDYEKFKQIIQNMVLDFVGFRIISAPKDFDADIESLDQHIKSLSPEEFLNNFLELSTMNDAFFENDILYTIRDFLYLNLSEGFESNGDDNKGFDALPKDYVDEPKPSGYRGIQFYCPFVHGKGKNEIQIRNFMQHFYAEYEHRRYEGKIESDELIPVYLACEICSRFFGDSIIKKMNSFSVMQIYSICSSVLSRTSIDFVHANYQYDLIDTGFYTENSIEEEVVHECISIVSNVNNQLMQKNLIEGLSEDYIRNFSCKLYNRDNRLYYVSK